MRTLWLLCLVSLLCCPLQPVWAQLTEDQMISIDTVFDSVNYTDSPGCALAIQRDGQIIYQKGYGMADLERHIAITPTTVFYAGSISKQFVASCALILAEEGALDLDARLGSFFPEFPSYGRDITVRQMIYHISGLRDYFTILEEEGLNYLNQIPRDTVYKLICSQGGLDFPVGERYSYSNSGYLLLAMIIEQVSGKSFSEFVRERIFQPLGMHHSMFLDNAATLVPNRAWGYHRRFDGEIENMLMRFDLVGSGGLYTTVEDLAKWDRNFYQYTLGNPVFFDKLLTTGKLNDGSDTHYAFAISRESFYGKEVTGHSGSLGGYRAQLMQFPKERISIIILSNLANFKPGEKAHKVAKILFDIQ